MRSISVIISTTGRPQQLLGLLSDLLRCDLTPVEEVVVVDESEDSTTKQIVSDFESKASVKVFYFRVCLGSLTKARNFAVKKTSGDLILFFDDDVRVQETELFNKVLRAFDENSRLKVLGVLAKREESIMRTLYEFARCLFLFNHPSKPFHAFSNGRNGGHLYLTDSKTCEAEWVAGYCFCARREVFDRTKFEERFMKYSFGEDFLFSHQIYLKYGGGAVRYLIGIDITHLEELAGRIPRKKGICMGHSYRMYISNKLGFMPNFSISKFLWKILILWGAIGDALFTVLVSLTKSRQVTRAYFKMALSHLRYCFLSLKYERELKADPNFIIKHDALF